MVVVRLVAVVALAACRIGFEERIEGSDAATGDADADADAPSDVPADSPATCDGYTMLAGLANTYRIDSMPRVWLAAEAACEADGAHLAVIDDDAENTQVQATAPTNAWIGASDRISEGIFLVVTGGATVYDHWQFGVPANVAEDCVQLRADAFWEDGDCTAAFAFVCECDGRPVVAGTF